MKPDIQLKKFFEHDDRFLSLFNAYFYHGESVLRYISLLYERELRKASPNNYTPKGTKLPMVRAIVLYTGEKEWDGARKLSDMILDEKDRDFYREKLASLSKN